MSRIAIILTCVVVIVGSGSAVMWRTSCPTCGQYPAYVAVPGVSDDANTTVAYIWDVIHRNALENKRITDEHAEYLVNAYDTSDELYARRWALVAMSAKYNEGVRMSDRADKIMRDTIRRALDDGDWQIRRCAVGCVQEAGLLDDMEFAGKVRALADDERPEVAQRVRRIGSLTQPGSGEGG